MYIGIGNTIWRMGGGVSAPNDAPSNLVLTVVNDTRIDVIVTINATNADGISWEYSTDGVTYIEHGTSVLGAYSYTGLTDNYYYFRCRNYKGSQYSAYCPVVQNTVPLCIYDGSTVAWYDSQDLTTITKDGSNLVSQWNDKLGSGHNLLQATGSNQPLWSATGIAFDGADDSMKTANFGYVQPESIFLVLNMISWTNLDRLMDGDGVGSGRLAQQGGTPQILISAGTNLPQANGPAVGTWGLVRILFNGVNSRYIVNDGAAVTGDAGIQNMGAITLGGRGDQNTTYAGNVAFAEVIFRNSDNLVKGAVIRDYLNTKYSLY